MQGNLKFISIVIVELITFLHSSLYFDRVMAVAHWYAKARVAGSWPVWSAGGSVAVNTTLPVCTPKCPNIAIGFKRIFSIKFMQNKTKNCELKSYIIGKETKSIRFKIFKKTKTKCVAKENRLARFLMNELSVIMTFLSRFAIIVQDYYFVR